MKINKVTETNYEIQLSNSLCVVVAMATANNDAEELLAKLLANLTASNYSYRI